MNVHEQRRLATLHEYQLLDVPAEDELEAVIRADAHDGGGTVVSYPLPGL